MAKTKLPFNFGHYRNQKTPKHHDVSESPGTAGYVTVVTIDGNVTGVFREMKDSRKYVGTAENVEPNAVIKQYRCKIH